MGQGQGVVLRRRVFPLRIILVLHAILLVLALLFGLMAWIGDEPSRLGASGIAVAALLVWLAAVRTTLLPRHPVAAVDPGAPLVVDTPRSVPALLVAGWLLMVVSTVVWCVAAALDLGSVDSPGFALVMGLAALGSIPDLVRLATGRLHRWRVVADDEGIHYRGWRTDARVPWSDVRRVRWQERPAGVVVEQRGETQLRIPITSFDEDPLQLAEALDQRRSRSSRARRS